MTRRRLRAAVARYSPRVKVWEIWNEPNLAAMWTPSPDPLAYTRLLQSAYAVVKSVDPTSTVLVGGLGSAIDVADGSQMAPETFLRQMYWAGARGSFDAVAVHPYTQQRALNDPSPVNQWARLPLVRDAMVQSSDKRKSVWVTEFGAFTGDSPAAMSEAAQAQLVSDAYAAVARWSWAGSLLLYSHRDATPDTTDPESNYGLYRYDFSPKPAVAALRAAL